jgi:hypothetical protein
VRNAAAFSDRACWNRSGLKLDGLDKAINARTNIKANWVRP